MHLLLIIAYLQLRFYYTIYDDLYYNITSAIKDVNLYEGK